MKFLDMIPANEVLPGDILLDEDLREFGPVLGVTPVPGARESTVTLSVNGLAYTLDDTDYVAVMRADLD
jgi:hypothetical protein